MTKRATPRCAFASCDQQDNGITSARQPLAIIVDRTIASHPQAVSAFVRHSFTLALPVEIAAIDHPPRPRLA